MAIEVRRLVAPDVIRCERRACRSDGAGIWPAVTGRAMRQVLRWGVPFALPALVAGELTNLPSLTQLAEAYAGLGIVAALLAMATIRTRSPQVLSA
jgi:hypothetical protein